MIGTNEEVKEKVYKGKETSIVIMSEVHGELSWYCETRGKSLARFADKAISEFTQNKGTRKSWADDFEEIKAKAKPRGKKLRGYLRVNVENSSELLNFTKENGYRVDYMFSVAIWRGLKKEGAIKRVNSYNNFD